jgi:VWFA-related protein
MVRALSRLAILVLVLGVSSIGHTQDSSGQPPITTIKARTNLVVIDVVVTDNKQNPIHGLAATDFTLTEDGVPQRIKNFEEHVSEPATETGKIVPLPKLPPGIFTNRTPAPAAGPINVLLLDTLNTQLDAQPFVRQQLLDYVNKAPAGTRIAIFGLSSSLSMLQGFTSDPAVLKAVLSGKKGRSPSDLLVGTVSGGPLSDTTLSTLYTNNDDGTDLSAPQAIANIQRFEALQTAFQLEMRSKFTLNAFNTLARYLFGFPGRKNVIWFSGSFPLSINPNPDLQDPNDAVVRNEEDLRETDNLLTRAQIAVYPVDARGLFNTSGMSAVNGGGASPTDMADFLTETATEHETMFAMAEDTGGHAFVNTNGLTAAVAKAIDNGSNYYTLYYSPTNPQWDQKFRTIKITLPQPKVQLSYRRGYYADDPDSKNKIVAAKAAMAAPRPSPMTAAMVRGAPDPTEIVFQVRIRPAAAPPENNAAPENKVNPDPKLDVKGPFKQYSLDFAPDPKAFSCPADEKGNHQCTIEVTTIVYDHDGVPIVTTTATTSAKLSAASFAKMQTTRMYFHQQISVPVKGEYFIRTAIHDVQSNRVGAVEVPVAVVAKLPPLATAPVAAQASPAAPPN